MCVCAKCSSLAGMSMRCDASSRSHCACLRSTPAPELYLWRLVTVAFHIFFCVGVGSIGFITHQWNQRAFTTGIGRCGLVETKIRTWTGMGGRGSMACPNVPNSRRCNEGTALQVEMLVSGIQQGVTGSMTPKISNGWHYLSFHSTKPPKNELKFQHRSLVIRTPTPQGFRRLHSHVLFVESHAAWRGVALSWWC